VGLNRLDPKYFLINDKGGPESLEDPDIAVRATTGETVLMRLLNANYHPQRWTWDTDVECVCSDGRAFAHGYALRELTMAPAERYDMILRPRRPGVHRVRVETLHWITGQVLGFAETLITVTGDALPDPAPDAPPAEPYEPPASSGQPAPAAAEPAPAPAAAQAAPAPAAPAPTPAAPAPAPKKPTVLGQKVKRKVSKAKPKKRKLSLKERLRRRRKAKAKKAPKAARGPSTKAGRKT
jgi:FtsP/CotA-like multicopper oxidase with cupredoxin domain